jgi:hypothetical protein
MTKRGNGEISNYTTRALFSRGDPEQRLHFRQFRFRIYRIYFVRSLQSPRDRMQRSNEDHRDSDSLQLASPPLPNKEPSNESLSLSLHLCGSILHRRIVESFATKLTSRGHPSLVNVPSVASASRLSALPDPFPLYHCLLYRCLLLQGSTANYDSQQTPISRVACRNCSRLFSDIRLEKTRKKVCPIRRRATRIFRCPRYR